MSQGLTNQYLHRDYGATSSSTNAAAIIPDVNFTGFSPTEFMSLSESIGQNINAVSSSWQQLKKVLQMIESNHYSPNMDEKVHKIQQVANAKIQATSKDLQRLTTVVRGGDKQQKLQLEKLTSDFRDVFEKYSAFQQTVAVKMKKIYLQSLHSQIDDEESTSTTDKEMLIKERKQLQNDIEFEQEMLRDRHDRIREIEADLLDTNAIMRELSIVMRQQGESVDLIETNIDHTCADVEAGASELEKAARSRSGYRRKVLILLAIAVIIGLIITGVIISELK